MTTPSMFDPVHPKLQTAWDSVSFGSLMKCPRYYQYTILEQVAIEKVDLEFGKFAASGFELYKKRRLSGDSKEDSMLAVIQWALGATYPDPFGQWVTAWHCDGIEPYKNGSGNKAVCPYAKKGAFSLGTGPDHCGLCGSTTKTSEQYVPDHAKKHRVSLLRALTWWMLDQPEDDDFGFHPYKFPDGTPAVELSWTMPFPRSSPSGTQYTLSGHFDSIEEFGVEHFVGDNKTTGTAFTRAAEGYSPHYQIDTYDLVGSIMYPDLIDGVELDITQLLTDGVKFGRAFFKKSEGQREEHLKTLDYWIGQAEAFALANYWPMNKAACWNCPFATICSVDPDQRQRLLDQLPKREWNPLIPR